MRAAPFYPYLAIPDRDWAAMQAVGAQQQRRTEHARHGEVWRDDSNFVGLCGEWCYAALVGHDWTPRGFYDGGTDFANLDVKASTSGHHRYLLGNRQGAALLKSPLYFLVTVDLDRHLAQPRGYATRAMLRGGSEVDTGYGRRQGVHVSELLTGDELLAHMLAGDDVQRLSQLRPGGIYA